MVLILIYERFIEGGEGKKRRCSQPLPFLLEQNCQ
jgi:hypothetical protein